MGVQWWLGLALNVLATFFMLGDLLSEDAFRRLLAAVLALVSLSVVVVMTSAFVTGGSIVNPLAAIWGQHSPLKLVAASALLGVFLGGLAAALRARDLWSVRWFVGLTAVAYGMMILGLLLAIPRVYFRGSLTNVPVGYEWLAEQPTLAIHLVYAIASFWSAIAIVTLPLVAGRRVSRALAKLPRARAVARWVNIAAFLASWLLQITDAL